jgi:hypothetical protein
MTHYQIFVNEKGNFRISLFGNLDAVGFNSYADIDCKDELNANKLVKQLLIAGLKEREL